MMQSHPQKTFAERVHTNQQKLASELGSSFDYIIRGAGSSGCVVAGRLVDLSTRVLPLVAGISDETDLINHPNRWSMALGSDRRWYGIQDFSPNKARTVIFPSADDTEATQLVIELISSTE